MKFFLLLDYIFLWQHKEIFTKFCPSIGFQIIVSSLVKILNTVDKFFPILKCKLAVRRYASAQQRLLIKRHTLEVVSLSLSSQQPRFSQLIDSRHFAFNYLDSVPLFRCKHRACLLPLELNGVLRKNKRVECTDNYDGRKIVIRNFNPILTPTIEILHFYIPLSSFVTKKFFGIHNDIRAFIGNDLLGNFAEITLCYFVFGHFLCKNFNLFEVDPRCY